MARVRAFRALRFTAIDETVVAPPYDVISPEERRRLGGHSPYNIVHLTLPEGGEERYTQAARLLQQWLEAGIVRPDAEPAFYRYHQTFRNPLTGNELTRRGYFVLLHTEPYERGVVLPHEHTFPGIKEDRFRLLSATRTHLETIFGLYEPTPALEAPLRDAPFETVAHLQGEGLPEGTEHILERLREPEAVRAIEEAFAPIRIWIADGHHRYETALRFGTELGTEGSPERFLPILLVPMSDPGLVILPTHRLLPHLPPGTASEWRTRLQPLFEVYDSTPEGILQEMQTSAQQGREGIGFVHSQGVWLLLPSKQLDLDAFMPPQASPSWKQLDVNLLHRIILPTLDYGQVEPTYTRSAQEVFQRVSRGESAVGFLLNPPRLEALRQIASQGEKMPHKSTYFYPKVLSGLIMWKLEGL